MSVAVDRAGGEAGYKQRHKRKNEVRACIARGYWVASLVLGRLLEGQTRAKKRGLELVVGRLHCAAASAPLARPWTRSA
eukprot:scaffold73160_cov30-Tisochrysis_lutea.AAC.2